MALVAVAAAVPRGQLLRAAREGGAAVAPLMFRVFRTTVSGMAALGPVALLDIVVLVAMERVTLAVPALLALAAVERAAMAAAVT